MQSMPRASLPKQRAGDAGHGLLLPLEPEARGRERWKIIFFRVWSGELCVVLMWVLQGMVPLLGFLFCRFRPN